MELDRPAPAGDLFQNRENVGRLLVIEVLEPLRGLPTQNGPADCIRANIWTIEPPGRVAERYMHTILYGQLLFSRLSQSVGRKVVGILTGQPGVTQNGRSVPYDLADPPDVAFQAAGQAMAAEAMTHPPQPATQAPGGWGQAPAQQPAANPWAGQQPQQAGNPWATPAAPDSSPWGQQQMPVDESVPPWERQQQPAAPPWGGQR